MKNYTTFPYEAVTHFKPRDLYTLAVLYLYATNTQRINNKEYYISDLTVAQIASYGNIKKDYIEKKFIPRLKESNYVIVETIQESYKIKRNIYKLPKPERDFRFIHKSILIDPLDNKLKGYLISLFCMCENNTLHFNYDFEQIPESIKISRASLYRYHEKLLGEYLFNEKVKSEYGSQYSYGIDIRCTWLRIHPNKDISGNTYLKPHDNDLLFDDDVYYYDDVLVINNNKTTDNTSPTLSSYNFGNFFSNEASDDSNFKDDDVKLIDNKTEDDNSLTLSNCNFASFFSNNVNYKS